MRIDWRTARIVIMAILALTFASLFPILETFFGITLTEPLFGFELRYILGVLTGIAFWMVWKVL